MPGAFSIQGLISNLDTNGIVDAIITAERKNTVLLENRQETATKQLTQYQAISAKMLGLQTNIQSLLKSSAFDAVGISVSDETALSATATGTVAPGTYTLNIDSLATNHQVASQGFADPALTSLGTGTITIGMGTASARTFTLDSTNNNLTALKKAINSANIGVTASIINDGSAANQYRLVLTANKTGTANEITVTSNLSGGTAPDFSGVSFDALEKVGVYTGSSSLALGGNASYTGSTNKTYTFTVAGSGTQTVGDAPITINWTDGTNSGSIDVSATGEVALTGTGADGLSVEFGSGTLVAGEAFQVQAFAPLLQAAQDARVSIGSTQNGGSPITVTSSTNEIDDLIEGLTLRLTDTTTSPVTINASLDTATVKKNITGMLSAYNDVMSDIDDQFSYNQDTGEAGVLLGDQFLLTLQSGLRSYMNGAIGGLPKGMNMLRSIGIQTAANGQMSLVDSSALEEALTNNLEGVRQLFMDSGTSSNSLISFISGASTAVESDTGYSVDITQVATKMVLQGAAIANPGDTPLTLATDNNTLRIVTDGVVSNDISLTAKTYDSGTALATELQDKINADAKIGERGVKVEWVDNGTTGYLKLTSGSYGSASRIVMQQNASTALDVLGLGAGISEIAGRDVQGTINGESATGAGRLLTGDKGNKTTDGIRLEVKLDSTDLVSGSEGTVTFTRGFASRLNRAVDSIARAQDGSLARRSQGIQSQIDDLKAQIAAQDERLAVRREKLYERFSALESALSQFQSQSQFLQAQLGQIAANTNSITGGGN